MMFKATSLANVVVFFFFKLPFEYYWIAGTSIASKVWKRDLKTVANSSTPRPAYSSNVNTSHVVVKIREHLPKEYILLGIALTRITPLRLLQLS